ncbi:MAG TPA: dephospho-CoA kinase [Bdellovibrio sp.]|nr:dephospho-CoA kinase [Bdellovibrio sp.]
MKWIGLTGGIACGKSTVAQALRMRSIPVIDADEIAREVVKIGSTGLKSITLEFGSDVLLPDGSLDRRKLAQKIFGDEKRRRKLESLTHPLIQAETRRRRKLLEEAKTPLAIYDIPLLFETSAQDQFDAIVVVSCSPEQQRERLRQRNQLSDDEIEKRLASQIPREKKEKEADFIIYNDNDENHLSRQIEKLIEWLTHFGN